MDLTRADDKRRLAAITVLSALVLFLEMLLVRWVSTEVRVFAYLQNGVLVAAFLGLGLGARNARSSAKLLPAAAALALIGLVVADPFRLAIPELLTRALTAFEDSAIWGEVGYRGVTSLADRIVLPRLGSVALALTGTLLLLCAVAVAFHPLGQRLGRFMDEYPRPIPAYSANLLGSLAGIALFDAATLLRTPPWAWLLAVALGLAVFAFGADDRRPARIAAIALVCALPVFPLFASRAGISVWSPYQKLSLEPLAILRQSTGQPFICGSRVNVNNAGYQIMIELDRARMRDAPDVYPPDAVRMSHYLMPYELVGKRNRVLVVGAGSGNDVAAALVSGAESVEAVEIDPLILEWGKAYHPDRPYGSPLVNLAIDDARAFFRRATGPYDMIWFGLLDSHTNPSAYTNVRLDHFVYTRESFADVKRLLAPGGVVVLFFQAQTEWIASRLRLLLAETFGAPPLAFDPKPLNDCLGWGGVLLVAGAPQTLTALRDRAWGDRAMSSIMLALEPPDPTLEVSSDDWPYLYLPRRTIPKYHLIVGLSCLGLGLLLRRRLFREGEEVQGSMLLLGMGFMLLEVTGVSRAALLFGTTWTVNAYVVSAILAMALFANLVAARFGPGPLGWPLAGLLASLLVLALLPTAALAQLALPLRLVLGGAFLALPVFFSGLVFVSLWAKSGRRDLALGSNLLGSLLGGIASMLSMWIGFQALGFVTLLVYLGVVFTLVRNGAEERAA